MRQNVVQNVVIQDNELFYNCIARFAQESLKVKLLLDLSLEHHDLHSEYRILLVVSRREADQIARPPLVVYKRPGYVKAPCRKVNGDPQFHVDPVLEHRNIIDAVRYCFSFPEVGDVNSNAEGLTVALTVIEQESVQVVFISQEEIRSLRIVSVSDDPGQMLGVLAKRAHNVLIRKIFISHTPVVALGIQPGVSCEKKIFLFLFTAHFPDRSAYRQEHTLPLYVSNTSCVHIGLLCLLQM